ncbi:hypothetical protein VP01_2835g3 [Puccinia sorghi]|uniref:Uncharacterized protein n=1 Tax=Puccinia sorghi TaxID=27349 RepID=A0A0L6V403_9BASI|nr:hypothetical protein VP01_2835g3 [Puccinia sorghi]
MIKEKQSILPCTVPYQQYTQAFDLLASGSVREEIQILKSLLLDDIMNSKKNSIRSNTLCPWISSFAPQLKIIDKLQMTWKEKELERFTQHQIACEAEFKSLYVGICLSCMSRQLTKLGKFAPAHMLLQTALCEINDPTLLSCHSFKELCIQVLLNQALCHLALRSLTKAKWVLYLLRASSRSLSLTFNNPKFLHSMLKSLFNDVPQVYDNIIASFPECCYQVNSLCPPNSSIQTIQSSFQTLGKILHPNQGGDTELMQRVCHFPLNEIMKW